MADAVDLWLNIGGWIVAGIVTVIGVLIAHWFQMNSERTHADQITLYEPLHRELQGILDRRDEYGGTFWIPSEAFDDLSARGALVYRRHNALRADIELLKQIGDAQRSVRAALIDGFYNSAWALVDSIPLAAPNASKKNLGDILGHFFRDPKLVRAIVTADDKAGVARLDELLGFNLTQTQMSIQTGLTTDQMFAKMVGPVRDTRRMYFEATRKLVGHAERMRAGLERVLHRGRGKYRH